ncbi:MFS transporter [Geodermatophilus amargosae]|uniref:MFS transporter n=1 Tax=Geodermatophilus amargosae TaxID=1296565 RepID=UPI003CCBD45C
MLLSQSGPAVVFGFTAVSASAFLVVLGVVRRPPVPTGMPPERFTSAIRTGGRYVRNSPAMRRYLLRVFLFVLPGAAMWALLPLVASEQLSSGSTGFGVLLGSLGVGAVAGAAVLPRLAARLSANRLLVLSAVLFTVSLVACVTVPNPAVLAVLLVPGGMAWLLVLMGVSAALQVFLPQWVRARGLATLNMVFAASQAAGSLLWGLVAQAVGLRPTFLAAAVLMVAGAVTVALWPLPDVAHLDRDPAVYWTDPDLAYEPDPRVGPVLVVVRYVVPPEAQGPFLEAMEPVRRSRLQTGATSCRLYQDGINPSLFVLVQSYDTWEEHLRQHTGRLTGADRQREEMAHSFAVDVEGAHLFPAVNRDLGMMPSGPTDAWS